jgi:chemotaxis protein methyltransferase CheR
MSSTTLTSETISNVCTIVRSRSAIELDESKSYLIEARLLPVARAHGMNSIGDLIQEVHAKRRPDLERHVVEAMTTNETSFFRDSHPFEALKSRLLPEIRATNATRRTLNIWSAACSTGQEIYSVAMTIREHFPEFANWNVQLVGTDLAETVLEKARAAKFSLAEVNRGLPALLLAKYFQRDGMHWQLRPELRGMAKFSKLNLIERWPPLPTMDIVFLRNVLIYFAPEVKRTILEKIRSVLAPHGVLFLGAAETTMGLHASFERVQVDNSVFYRHK